MNLQQQTQNVAAQGRFGDSMLLHVNPAEVAGLSQVMPLTINPETGQPEAFLPMLLPLLGSIGGTALAGTGFATALGLGGLSGAALGAIGSGLGTAIATGDIKKGILSGLTGYGLGKVFTAGKTAADAAKAGAEAGATTLTSSVNPTDIGMMGTSGVMPEAVNAATTGATAGAGSGLSAGLGAAGKQLMKPGTMIPLALGLGGQGVMQSQEDFQRAMSNLKNQDEDEYNRILAEHPEYVPMLQYQTQTYQRGGRTGEKLKKEFKPVAAIQAREIDPFFMSGLQGERAYLQNVNPSSGQIISGKSGYAFGSEGADAPMSAPFDPTQTVGYQAFYNAPREPYVLDPYAKQNFTKPDAPVAPQPVIKTAFEEISEPQSQATLPVPPPEPAPAPSRVNPFNPYNLDIIENVRNLTGISAEGREESETGVPSNVMDVIAPPMVAPTPIMPTNEPIMMADTSGLSNEELESGAFNPALLGSAVASPIIQDYFAPQPPITTTVPRGQDRAQRRIGRNRKAEGGKTYPNEGLEALAKSGEKGKEAVEAMGYQEGGLMESQIMTDPLTNELVDYLLGRNSDSSIVDKFVGKYGNEAYMEIRNMVLKQSAMNQMAMTEGLIAGNDQGAMTDDINGVMGGGDTSEQVAVSQGEYIIPGDVVSHLGDGDTNSGASKLDDMLDRIRMARTGTEEQAPRINPNELLPA